MKKSLVIIPAYNEEKNIVAVVNRIKKLKISNCQIDYIVINDGSTDNTKEICQQESINYLDLPCNLGIGGAVQSGYKYAEVNNYDYAIQFDGDGQHNEIYIKKLIEEIDENDMVIGSRFIEKTEGFKSSASRRAGIKFLSGLIKICTGKKIHDVTSGFRLCNRKVIKEFSKFYPVDYPEPDSIVRLLLKGYKINETSVVMFERENGISSISGIRKSLHYMIKVSLAILITKISRRR